LNDVPNDEPEEVPEPNENGVELVVELAKPAKLPNLPVDAV
jgi:hypothetical protein